MQLIATLMTLVISAAPALAQTGSDYQSLLTSPSIFSADRGVVRTKPSTDKPAPAPAASSEMPPFFVGVTNDGNDFAAYFEGRDGRISTFRRGDSLPWDDSVITELDLSHLTVRRGTEHVTIALGHNLLNQPRPGFFAGGTATPTAASQPRARAVRNPRPIPR